MNEEGMIYGAWEVIEEGARSVAGRRRMLCRCTCGTEKLVQLNVLRSGESSGCRHCEHARLKPLKPKRSKPERQQGRLYRVWASMMARCFNPNAFSYKDYGGRGITVCERWQSFTKFQEDMGDRAKGLTLERKENDGNYEPDNCCWASRKDQARNTRRNRNLTVNGETKTLAEWCEKLRINSSQVIRLLKNGWLMSELLIQFRKRPT